MAKSLHFEKQDTAHVIRVGPWPRQLQCQTNGSVDERPLTVMKSHEMVYALFAYFKFRTEGQRGENFGKTSYPPEILLLLVASWWGGFLWTNERWRTKNSVHQCSSDAIWAKLFLVGTFWSEFDAIIGRLTGKTKSQVARTLHIESSLNHQQSNPSLICRVHDSLLSSCLEQRCQSRLIQPDFVHQA